MKYIKLYEEMSFGLPKFIANGLGRIYNGGIKVITSGLDGKTLDTLNEKELNDVVTILTIIDQLSQRYDSMFQSKYPEFTEIVTDFKNRFPIEEVNRRLMEINKSREL
jgi:hypothetical protein